MRIGRTLHHPFLRYGLVGALVIGLFAAGYLASTAVMAALAASPEEGSDAQQPASGGALVDPPHQVQDFTLTSHTGDPISLSDLQGQAVLMFFGYTHCPDVCPTTLADYRRVKQALGADAEQVAFVFISVGGERDTPDVLSEYLRQFDADFIGMTGDAVTLRRIGAEYGLFFETETVEAEEEQGQDHDLDQENYFVNHTSPSFLIDPDGYLRLVYFYGTAPQTIADGIRQMLH
mgnify:CR=1 FL=1